MINIDMKLPKNMMRRFDKLLDKHIKQAEKDIIEHLLKDVDTVKRFKDQTGRLRDSIKVKYTKDGISIYLDDKVADYGKYVYQGTNSWKADKFLENALIKSSTYIYGSIRNAVRRAVNELNKG
jgi:metal-responsive CopG/Arc/MetJ family transcriptional regulator